MRESGKKEHLVEKRVRNTRRLQDDNYFDYVSAASRI